MQKKYADFKLFRIKTGNRRGETCVPGRADDSSCRCNWIWNSRTQVNMEDILVTSEDTVRCVKLRWNYKIPKSARFLGGLGTYSYGDVEWHGMSGNRYLPWYFLAKFWRRFSALA